ncbi:MAG: hypothetical protein IJS25_02315, partial [Bacteroidales bacterium]|nr:hypothetical protein [Bacteroidales bacterium]
MFIASMTTLTCCASDDIIEENYGDEAWNSETNGSSSTTDALATFDIIIDRTVAEPESTVDEYF